MAKKNPTSASNTITDSENSSEKLQTKKGKKTKPSIQEEQTLPPKKKKVKKARILPLLNLDPNKKYMILGVDPALERTGFGLISVENGKPTYITHALLITKPKNTIQQRLQDLFVQAKAFIDQYDIDIFVIEELFVGINRNTIIKLSMARSIILLLANMKKAQIIHIPTRIVKQKITGCGGSTKEQVLEIVCQILQLENFSQLDCSDALACSLCYMH